MSDEMYPDTGVDQLIWERANCKSWPFIDDVSSVSIVTSATDLVAINAEFVLKQ